MCVSVCCCYTCMRILALLFCLCVSSLFAIFLLFYWSLQEFGVCTLALWCPWTSCASAHWKIPDKYTVYFFHWLLMRLESYSLVNNTKGKGAYGPQERYWWPFSLFSTGTEISQNSRDQNLNHSACCLPAWALTASPLAKTWSNKESNTSATACPLH